MIGTVEIRPARAWTIGLALALASSTGCNRVGVTPAAATGPSIHWDAVANKVEARNLPKDVGNRLRKDESLSGKVFAVSRDMPDAPPILGRYAVAINISGSTELLFFPRFPFEPGLSYRAVLDSSAFPEASPLRLESKFAAPAAPVTQSPAVSAVYPTSDKLPENLLRFYLHFATPMRRGEAYEHIHLRDDKGADVATPFLEMSEELWDPSGRRLTLLINPGRIKRGLKPREDLGPVLESGRTYLLVIDAGWRDAAGQPLAKPFEKKFYAGLPVERGIEVKDWKVNSPVGATMKPLVINFPAPLDHALLLRKLSVVGPDGQPVSGDVTVAETETRWTFTPTSDWKPGNYVLVVERALEDVAGNRVGRAFEVDEDTRPIDADNPAVHREFVVR
jgi:hypothetical protein